MAAILGGQERSYNFYGTQTTVPDNDICKLSYYLNCINGLIQESSLEIRPELINYRKADVLWTSKQDEIISLSLLLEPHGLLDKLFILDNDRKLLPNDYNNKFCELKEVTSLMAVSSSTFVGGQQTKIAKVMICHSDWFDNNWVKPMKRLMSNAARVKRVCSQSVSEMSRFIDAVDLGITFHCLQGSVDDMPILTNASSSSSSSSSASRHCAHCHGYDGVCSCRDGCLTTSESRCTDHPHVICDWCKRESFRGARYKCRECYNYDLCRKCYLQEEDTHVQCSFARIVKQGDDPINLPPRQKSHPPTQAPAKSPMSSATTMPTQTANAYAFKAEATVVNPPPTAPMAEAIPVAGLEVGQWVRVIGLDSNKAMNGRCGVIVKSLPGDDEKYLVNLSGGANEKMVFQGKNLESRYVPDPKYPLDGFVQLQGLTSPSGRLDNGKYGVITGYGGSADDRVCVKLFDEDRTVSVKKSNVTVFSEAG